MKKTIIIVVAILALSLSAFGEEEVQVNEEAQVVEQAVQTITCQTKGLNFGNAVNVDVTIKLEGSVGLSSVATDILAMGTIPTSFVGTSSLQSLTDTELVLKFVSLGVAGEESNTQIEIQLTKKNTDEGVELTGFGKAKISNKPVFVSNLKDEYILTDCQGVLK